MYYYKVLDENNQVLGYGTTQNLCYYNRGAKRLISCREDVGQYICINNTIYRIPWLHQEDELCKNKYPKAFMESIPYEEYKKQFEKENLE